RSLAVLQAGPPTNVLQLSSAAAPPPQASSGSGADAASPAAAAATGGRTRLTSPAHAPAGMALPPTQGHQGGYSNLTSPFGSSGMMAVAAAAAEAAVAARAAGGQLQRVDGTGDDIGNAAVAGGIDGSAAAAAAAAASAGCGCSWPLNESQLQHLKQRIAAMPALQVLELAGFSVGQADELFAMLLARPTLLTKVASDGRVMWVGPETPRICLPSWRNDHQPNRELPPGLSTERGLLRLPEEPQPQAAGG
ncbi:hypothetical protein Vretimale_19187, partial [Volvox reticuliferus]